MNSDAKRKLDCGIVRDLLPLYCDGDIRETTAAAVKEHMDDCLECRKEYEALRKELPIQENEIPTKSRFMNMMCRQRRRRLLLAIISIVVVCALLVAVYFVQSQFPISNIPSDEITVLRVYRYETEQGYKFFFLFTIPYYDNFSGKVSVEKSDYGDTLVMELKKPIITKKHKEWGANDCVWVYECGWESGDNGAIDFVSYEAVEFGGEIVWNETTNGEDEIPEYVYAYEDFNTSQENVSSWFVSSEEGYLGAGYSEGGVKIWDFDGQLLSTTVE